MYELEFAVVAVGGIGRKAATLAASVVADYAQPELLISAGVVGALRPELRVGDRVIAREVLDAEAGTRFPTARFNTRALDGVVVTVNAVEGEDSKRMLHDRFGADVVDMEAAAVAAVAQQRGIDFAVVKAVSDELAFTMPPLGRFVDEAGQFHMGGFVAYIAMRPRWWGAVGALSKNTKLASVNLSLAVEHLIQQYSTSKREENVSLG